MKRRNVGARAKSRRVSKPGKTLAPGIVSRPCIDWESPDPRQFPPGMIAVPAIAWVWTDFLLAFSQLERPPDTIASFEAGGCTIAEKRNRLVKHFLEKKQLQWLLCLDSDMTPPWNTIPTLLAAGRDVITALCCKKGPPFHVCAGHYDDKTGKMVELLSYAGAQNVKEIDWTGTACLMIRREVFEAIPDPWFEAEASGIGSDMNFCRKVQGAGFQLHCDTTLWVGHITPMAVDLEYRAARESTKAAREKFRMTCRQPASGSYEVR